MASFDLFEHQINQFGAVTVLDVILRDVKDKKPLLYLDTLKVSSIAMEGSTKTIKGGIGAPDLIEYDYGRVVNFEMQDALASLESLSLLWGGQLNALNLQNTVKIMEVTTEDAGALSGEALLSEQITPIDSSVVVTGEKGSWKLGTEADKTYRVIVDIPTDAAEGAAELILTPSSLPPTVELVGRTFFIERSTGKQMEYQLRIPMLKINMGGGLTMEAEGDAAVFDFSGKALVDPITKQQFILTRTGNAY